VSTEVTEDEPAEATVVVASDVEVPISARLPELEERVHRAAGVSSLFFTILLGTTMLSSIYALNWILNIERFKDDVSAVGVEMVEMEDGEEEGKKGVAADIEEVPEDMPNREEAVDTAPPDLANDLLQMIQQTDFTDPSQAQRNRGAEGAGYGTKGKGFGKGGTSRAQRWVIEWGSDTEIGYRRKLDFLKIYIGAVRGGQLVGAVRGFGNAPRETNAKPPDLWFVHQDKTRVDTDRKLLREAGVPVSPTDIICQFYPPELQAQMVAVETKHQGKKENEIKKTVFGIKSSGSGYELAVLDQQLN
jgi:hypothetical protein